MDDKNIINNDGMDDKEKSEADMENFIQNMSETDLLNHGNRGNALSQQMKNEIDQREMIQMPSIGC